MCLLFGKKDRVSNETDHTWLHAVKRVESVISLNIFYCQIYTATGLGHKFSQQKCDSHQFCKFNVFLSIIN